MIVSNNKFILSVFIVCLASSLLAIQADDEMMDDGNCKPGKRVRFAPLPVIVRPEGRRIPNYKVPKKAKSSQDKSEGCWRSKVWSSIKNHPGYYVLGGLFFVGAGFTILHKSSERFRRKVSNPLVAKLKSFAESLKTESDCSALVIKDANEDKNDL